MNIGFILPGAAISGGIYVVFEHATRLNRIFGHQVFIITESKVAPEEYAWHESAKELIWLSFDEAIGLKFNCLIATFWRTVYELPRLHADHYVYFAQSIESKFYPDEDQYVREWVDSTYALGLTTITEATWIKQYLNNNYAGQVFLVKNGIRKDLYTQEGNSIAKKDSNRLRVLVEGPLDIPFKNVKKTLELCKASDADEVWLLTSSITENDTLADKVFSKVPITKVPEIYRSCDVIVKLSYVEGMFGPPLEMFHCGGTAIVYNVTGYEEYIVNEHNALVIEKDNEQGVIEAINRLKSDKKYLAQLKNNAINTADAWSDWEIASRNFNQVLLEINRGSPVNRDIIISLTNQFNKWVSLAQDNLRNQEELKIKLENILNSYSWKVTAPLRYILYKMRKICSIAKSLYGKFT